MSENHWIKRAKLFVLSIVGISAVTIPVTAALLLSGASDGSTLAFGAPTRVRPARENPAEATKESVKCSPTKGCYALTFDDGPYIAAHPDLVELQRTVGQVANHSYTNPHRPEISQGRRVQELTETAKALGHPNAFVRPPYGETSPATHANISKSGLVPVYWTTNSHDWQKPPVDVIVKRAVQAQPEGIVLMHDGRENTIQAMARIVSELRSQGMCPGSLAETDKTVVSAGRKTQFDVIAVSPRNDSGLAGRRA
jgi:peptidoglycan/xylan/chitin deacetylase (PgdA/CDA1 family)